LPYLFVRKQKDQRSRNRSTEDRRELEDFVAGPRNILEGKWTMVDIDAEFNGTLHGTTQTRCIILLKATDNAL